MTSLRTAIGQTRPLGTSGISVSALAWGMWRLSGDDVAAARARIDAALAAGITLFDTADIYGFGTPGGFGSSEALFGRALAEDRSLHDRMVIATKGGITPPVPYDSSAAYLDAALDASLQRLGIDHVDLYQVHRRDFLTHPADLAATLARMVESGKVRTIGVSNYSPAETAALRKYLPVPIVSTQPEYSPLATGPLFDGTIDQAMAEQMAIFAWSPLAGGRIPSSDHPVVALLEAQGQRYGTDATAAALSWAMVHPAGIIPIVGTQTVDRITRSADAYAVEWTRTEWYAVLETGSGRKLP